MGKLAALTMVSSIALAASSAAHANVAIVYTLGASNEDFVGALPANLLDRKYSGNGVMTFSSTPTDGVYGLADLAGFSLNLQIAVLLNLPPVNPWLTADYSFGKADLSAFSITFAGGTPVAASWTMTPVAAYHHFPAGFNPVSQSVDFKSGNDKSVSFYGWPDGIKTLFATGELDASLVRIPAVPEPASWAMLIAGFAATGVALRRARATTASYA